MGKFIRFFKKYILPLIYFDTFGNIAISSLLICTISGVFLAILFDVEDPYNSLSRILLVSSSGSFYRNLHYWSAQLFMVFTFLHIWDHFNKETESKIKPGVWLRLTISIGVTLFVMLSGFILKADQDSLQALRIFRSFLDAIPLIGDLISNSFLGKEDSFQIIYIHHIATATIFLFIIIFEHAKYIWTKLPTLFYTLTYAGIASLLLTPVLHDSLNPVIKGPWYFLGLQEILHWTSDPIYTIIFLLLLIALFFFLPRVQISKRIILKNGFIYLTVGYLLITLFAYYFRGENWELTNPLDNPKLNYFQTGFVFNGKNFPDSTKGEFLFALNRVEACLNCHQNTGGFTASHDPNAIGCSGCHAGNPFSFDKDIAHSGMYLIPGNESNYARTCGTSECHAAIVQRVPNSIMSTLSGMISVNKFVFNETDRPDGLFDVRLLGNSAADNHLKNLCVSCHIGNEKTEWGPVNELSRGGGCNACHLNYSDETLVQLNRYESDKNKNSLPSKHPSLSLDIKNDHCFGCHSRSGRISTNYEGWHETKLTPDSVKNKPGYRILSDERVFEFKGEDVHHKAGMECIDCHNSYEVMGDGNLYAHKEEQVKIQCIDCHLTDSPETKTYSELDFESKKIADIRDLKVDTRRYLTISNSGIAIINTYIDSLSQPKLITKNNKKILSLNSPATICVEGRAHKDLSCNSCHTAWVPQCIGCHTDYNPGVSGYDLLKNEEIDGQWIEHIGDYFSDQPTLGVNDILQRTGESKREIVTFMPGMIMSLDKSNFIQSDSEIIFKRLFSPTFSHTIVKQSRSCKSCHNDPLAIGYGRGEMNYKIVNKTGRWIFNPKYSPVKYDGLPEDAWIGFLQERKDIASTRSDYRPFKLSEQKKILTVGACLTCHNENSEIIANSLVDFEMVLSKVSPKCILPDFK